MSEAYQSGRFGRLLVAEVLSDRVNAVRRTKGRYGLNIARKDGVKLVDIGPIELCDPSISDDDRETQFVKSPIRSIFSRHGGSHTPQPYLYE